MELQSSEGGGGSTKKAHEGHQGHKGFYLSDIVGTVLRLSVFFVFRCEKLELHNLVRCQALYRGHLYEKFKNYENTLERLRQKADSRQQTADSREWISDNRHQIADSVPPSPPWGPDRRARSREQGADGRQQTSNRKPQTADGRHEYRHPRRLHHGE